MLEELRQGLHESYKHRVIAGVTCITCGRADAPLALHLVEFYHSDRFATPSTLVRMSESRGTRRGSVPLCNSCSPACRTCLLPVGTPWLKRVIAALQVQYPAISFVFGNGHCRHVHVLLDLKSMFRKVTLASAQGSELLP